METKIQAIHFEISERLTDHINKKIDRLSRRYPNVTRADINLRVLKPETAMNKEAVVMFASAGNGEIVTSKVADTFEEAFDVALEAAERRLEKTKNKE